MLENRLARLTAWLVRHRLAVLICAIIPTPFLIYGYLNVQSVLKSIVGSNESAHSTVVSKLLAERFSRQVQFMAQITFHHDKLTADDAPFLTSVAKVNSTVQSLGCVRKVITFPELPKREVLIAKDGHTQLSLIEIGVPVNAYTQAEECIAKIRKRLGPLKPALPARGIEVLITGTPAVNLDIGKIVKEDSRRAEIIVIFFAFFLLIWMFRSASASVLPLFTALLAVTSTLTVCYLLGLKWRISIYVSNVSTMTGLALGLDYALLYVTRFKEELDNGHDTDKALEITSRTAGKAILGSGTLVMFGFGGLFLPDLVFPRSVALAGVLSVFFTLFWTLLFLPVLLSYWRPTLGWPRWGWFRASHAAVDRFWGFWADMVLKRPVVPLVLAAIIVGVAAPNVFSMKVYNPRHEIIPKKVEARQGVDRIVEVIGVGQIYPVTVLVELKDGSTWKDKKRQQKILKVLAEIRTWPNVDIVRSADMLMGLSVQMFGKRIGMDFGEGFAAKFLSDDYKILSVDIHAKDVNDRKLSDLVVLLREKLPQQVADEPGMKVWVGGRPAMSWETLTMLFDALPLMIPMVVVLALILMALLFKSFVISTKAVVLNILSMSTTFGILVLVFQYGYGISLLGHTGAPPGALSLATPIVMFCVLFGVSMDYEVFLVSRVEETWKRLGGPTATPEEQDRIHLAAIREGLSRTGGIITNAAFLMVLTFVAFLSGSLLPMKEMGFALALAVALDATLVRMMLVPAVLRLAGRRTWWWPFGRVQKKQ
jgi:putative drug exporter of the RND superfamily